MRKDSVKRLLIGIGLGLGLAWVVFDVWRDFKEGDFTLAYRYYRESPLKLAPIVAGAAVLFLAGRAVLRMPARGRRAVLGVAWAAANVCVTALVIFLLCRFMHLQKIAEAAGLITVPLVLSGVLHSAMLGAIAVASWIGLAWFVKRRDSAPAG